MTGAFSRWTSAAATASRCGRSGRTGPRTYLGLAWPGFPNLFLVTGPGSPSVLSNMMVSIEQHVDWIADCLGAPRDRRARRPSRPTRAAEEEWVEHVNEVGDITLYPRPTPGTWAPNVPGKPRVFLPYVGGVGEYRRICCEVAADGYRGFEITPAGTESDAGDCRHRPIGGLTERLRTAACSAQQNERRRTAPFWPSRQPG